ncbi:hypothetical protein RB195_018121 [Necator americanus]
MKCLTGIGYCPQEIVLLNNLTVLDNIWFFYQLKCQQENWKEKAESIVESIGLEEYLFKRTTTLNNSQKRLLGIAISFIGNSSVIILDEPFSDLDARSSITFKTLLEKEKERRCVLIGTSSACTAEIVADYILVLYNGREVAAGSPSILREKFGHNYVLNVLLESGSSSFSIIEKHVRDVIPLAEMIRAHGNQLKFGLLKSDPEKRKQLLLELEKRKVALGITDFYIRFCSIQDVYQRIEIQCQDEDEMCSSISFDRHDEAKFLPPRQFVILLLKKLYLSFSCYLILAQVVTPMLLLLAANVFFNQYHRVPTADKEKSVSLEMYRHGRFIVFNPNGIALESYRILKAISSHKNIEVMWANSSDFCASWPPDWPFVVGAVAFGYDVEYSEFEEATCSLRMPVSPSESEQNDSFITWRNFNAEEFQTVNRESDQLWIVPEAATYAYPTIVELITQHYFGDDSGGNGNNNNDDNNGNGGNGDNEELIMDIELNNQTKSSLLRDLAAFAITLGHVVLVSSFVTIPLQERVARFKKQQFSTGVSVFVYWLASFTYDLIGVMIAIFFLSAILFILNFRPTIFLTFVVCFFMVARLPMIYFVSLFLSNPLQALIFISGLTICCPLLEKLFVSSTVIRILYPVFPSLSFFAAMEQYTNTDCAEVDNAAILSSNILVFILFTILLFSVEKIREHCCRQIQSPLERNMDSDVLLVGGEEIELKPGECIALLGQKSDTRPIITQMATAARKRCGNFKLANSSGPQVAFCSRENSLFPSLSLKSNLEIIAGIAGQSPKTVKKMFAALHEKNRVNSPFSQCSKMEQRRACITATAMSASPVILFEMPAYAVDLKTRLYTWDVIRGLQRAGRTVIFTTDSHEECEVIADRVGIVCEGEIITLRTISELKAKHGNFVVFEVSTTTEFDRDAVSTTVTDMLPECTILPENPSNPLMLRWKFELGELDFIHKFDRIQQILNTLPVKESSIMTAPLDVIAGNVIEEHRKNESD